MALFFLHIRNGPKVAHDVESSPLPDLAPARTEAIQSARELMSQGALNEGRLGIDRLVEIADEAGQILLSVPCRSVKRFARCKS